MNNTLLTSDNFTEVENISSSNDWMYITFSTVLVISVFALLALFYMKKKKGDARQKIRKFQRGGTIWKRMRPKNATPPACVKQSTHMEFFPHQRRENLQKEGKACYEDVDYAFTFETTRNAAPMPSVEHFTNPAYSPHQSTETLQVGSFENVDEILTIERISLKSYEET
ncbi:uncharacterized protein [Parasteatoda tepidariorum]|uniref:uncharacterized protein isoform X1 n=2 Tax=Parasteatoda tepidariorum TaxID=114398 RepID=UPI0039BCCBF2